MDKIEELINDMNADTKAALNKYYCSKDELKTLRRRYAKRGEEIKLLKHEIKELKRQLMWFGVN